MNDAIDFFNEMKSNLKLDPNNDSEDFEEALKNLGRLLGFYSIRPEKEKNEGPDNLWLFENNICLIMESKSEKEHHNIISKSDISQLLHSLEWFDSKYINKDAEVFGVTVQYNRKKENDVVIRENIRVLDNINFTKLENALGKYIDFLSNYRISEINEEMLKSEFLTNSFSSNLFVEQYLIKIQ